MDKIVEFAEYGEHIALKCRLHPQLKWSTKNIGYIGARSIFYCTKTEIECNCPVENLVPCTEAEGHPWRS